MIQWKDVKPEVKSYLLMVGFHCKECNRKIVHGQEKYFYCGNLYHEICSRDIKERERIV